MKKIIILSLCFILSSCTTVTNPKHVLPQLNDFNIKDVSSVEVIHYRDGIFGDYCKTYVYNDQKSIETCYDQINSKMKIISEEYETTDIHFTYNFITDEGEYRITFGEIINIDGIKYQYYEMPYYFNEEKLIDSKFYLNNDKYLEKYQMVKNIKLPSKNYENYLDCYFSNSYISSLNGFSAYESIGSLLSFYDNYYNDDIVLEEYDIPSESNLDSLSNRLFHPKVEWSSFMNDYPNLNKEKSFYYKSLLNDLSSLSSNKTMKNLNYKDRIDLLNNYFDSRNIDSYNILSSLNDQKEFIIKQLNDQRPVLVELENDDGIGLCGVAYKYDSINDIIYYNNPFNLNHDLQLSGFNKINNAIAIDYYGAHNCSNNYRIYHEDGSFTNHCQCYFNDFVRD